MAVWQKLWAAAQELDDVRQIVAENPIERVIETDTEEDAPKEKRSKTVGIPEATLVLEYMEAVLEPYSFLESITHTTSIMYRDTQKLCIAIHKNYVSRYTKIMYRDTKKLCIAIHKNYVSRYMNNTNFACICSQL